MTKPNDHIENIFKDVFFNETEDCVLGLNHHEEIIIMNQSACVIFDTEFKKCLYQPFKDLCHQKSIISPLPKNIKELGDGITLINKKVYFPHSSKTYTFKIVPIKEKKQELQLLLVGNDVSALEERQRTNLKSNQTDLPSLLDTNHLQQNLNDSLSKSPLDHNPLTYFENIIDLLPGIIYWKNCEGVYLGCNLELMKLMNFETKQSIIGKTDFEIFSPKEAKKLSENDLKVIQTGETLIVEEHIINADGIKETFISTKRPLMNSYNETVGILGISTDITARKASEIKLAHEKEAFEQFYDRRLQKIAQISKQVTGQDIDSAMPEEHLLSIKTYLENIISCLPGLVFWKDQNGVYLGCNDSLMRLRGFISKNEIVGKTDYEIFTKEEAMVLRENDQHVMQTQEPASVEETVVMANQQTITYLTNKVPLLDYKGESIGVLGISLDITEKKKAEDELQKAKIAAEKANKAKTEFLANMSHDLRAPLHGILGMSDVLLSKKHYPEQVDYINTLKNAGVDLLELIEDILSYSELENKDSKLSLETINITTLTKEIAALFNNLANEKNLKLTEISLIDQKTKITSYSKAIKRIISNLLNNALKFSEKGEIKLISEIIQTDNQSPLLVIKVKDTGIGIPENKLSTIFEKFSRINPSFEGKYKGVGLGLAIVKQFVDKLNGNIEVKSKINSGTTFTVTLPITIAIDTKKPEINEQNLSDDKLEYVKSLELKTLIIEDDKIGRKFASLVLSDLNCQLTIVKDGEEALNNINEKYDVIFSDVGLPDISGFEIAREIRKPSNPNHKTTLIAITGHAAEHDKKACEEVGFDDVLKKPLSMDGFKSALIKWFTK